MRRILLGLVFLPLFALWGCAGDKADLEDAKYLLGKGDSADAHEAFDIVKPMLASSTGEEKFEVVQLYSGAEMQMAGFDGIHFLSTFVYRDSNQKTIALLKSAVAINAESKPDLADANSVLDQFIASSTFTSETDTRLKAGIYYQKGLAEFFEAIRITLADTGVLDSSTFTVASCKNGVLTDLQNLQTSLNLAHSNFILSGLDEGNEVVKLVVEMQNNVPDATDATQFCNYLQGQ